MILSEANFNPGPDFNKIIEQFEQDFKFKSSSLFEEEEYIDLFYHYKLKDEHDKANYAVEIGLEYFKTSLDLLLTQSSIYTEDLMLEKAHETLDYAELFYPGDPKILFKRASILHLSGEDQSAIQLLESIENTYESKESVWLQIGFFLMTSGKFKQALKYFEKAVVSTSCLNDHLVLQIAACYFESNQVKKGLALFQGLVDTDPYDYLAWFGLGLLHKFLNQNGQAYNALDYAVTIHDKLDLAWFEMGILEMNDQKYVEARRCFLKANDALEDLEYLTHIAAASEQLEDYKMAFKYYKKTTEIDPEWEDGWYGMSSVLFEQEKFIEAIHYIKKAIELNEYNAAFFSLLADCEARLGNFESADEAYETSVELNPEDIDAWLNWSLLYFENGEYVQAGAVVFNAIDHLPTEADLHYRAFVYLMFEGKQKMAVTYLQTALDLDFAAHEQLYDFFSNLATLKTIQKIIDQYRNKNK
jgi:tetratricopeptide (TPR) repeat protein